jgi:hypothetical protein
MNNEGKRRVLSRGEAQGIGRMARTEDGANESPAVIFVVVIQNQNYTTTIAAKKN